MARPKRGAQVPPPSRENEWELRYATKESLHLAEMEKQFPGNTDEAKRWLRTSPDTRSDACKPLRGSLGVRRIGGVEMPQWQYDISSGARLWYCIDEQRRIVWITLAATGHPRATGSRNKRAPRNR